MTRATDRVGVRKIVWKKANGRCAHCGRKVSSVNQTVDHYIPRSRGGTWDRKNLLPLCRQCNYARGARKINPREYYKYASEWAIKELEEYERKFNEEHNRMG